MGRLLRTLAHSFATFAWFAAFLVARVERGGRRGGRVWRRLYRAHMRSSTWQRHRARTLRRAGGTCARLRCDEAGSLDVHHRTYLLMGWDPWLVLVAICRPCHEAAHGWRIPRGGRARAGRRRAA